MLRETERYPYLPLFERPKIAWPNGARVAFWVVPNIEFYELIPPQGGAPSWPHPAPDILNYSHRDYGNRVGIWRIMEVMERYGVRGSVSLNAALCDHHPEIIEACNRLGWELFSHGIYNTRFIYGMNDGQVAEMIRDSIETIREKSGQEVRGFLAPAISSTETFLDLLPDFGIKYTIDMVPDDQPLPIRVRRGRLMSIPYSTDINDIRVMGVRGYTPSYWASMMKANFDQLYEEGAENGMVVCMPLHPFITGQPHRIDHLAEVLRHVTSHSDVWIATGSEIADWYDTHYYDTAISYLKERGEEGW